MQPAAEELSAQTVTSATRDWPADPAVVAQEPRNFALLAAHQSLFGIGWFFKTESVIIPAFLDWLGGEGTLRGCLPLLSRVGQSVPPVFYAQRLKTQPFKKNALVCFTVLTSLPLGLLSLACYATDQHQASWLRQLFLALYGAFFLFYGLYLTSLGTLQGKLIRPNRRGHLLRVSTATCTPIAVILGWLFLQPWLASPIPAFGSIFAFATLCFLLAALMITAVGEPAAPSPPRPHSQPSHKRHDSLLETWRALRQDRNLRRLVIVGILVSSSLTISPHYQNIALELLGLSRKQLMAFVVTQNIAVGVTSLLVGSLADAWGNRLTLRSMIFCLALAPVLAMAFSLGGEAGKRLFWTVFIPLGMSPLWPCILFNYALEISEPPDHPRYLSTVRLGMVLPVFFSPAIGWLFQRMSLAVLAVMAALTLLGGLVTFCLDEPRSRCGEAALAPISVDAEP